MSLVPDHSFFFMLALLLHFWWVELLNWEIGNHPQKDEKQNTNLGNCPLFLRVNYRRIERSRLKNRLGTVFPPIAFCYIYSMDFQQTFPKNTPHLLDWEHYIIPQNLLHSGSPLVVVVVVVVVVRWMNHRWTKKNKQIYTIPETNSLHLKRCYVEGKIIFNPYSSGASC